MPLHIGPGAPEESGICLQACTELGPSFPLFGVCMGHQCIGQAFGGEWASQMCTGCLWRHWEKDLETLQGGWCARRPGSCTASSRSSFTMQRMWVACCRAFPGGVSHIVCTLLPWMSLQPQPQEHDACSAPSRQSIHGGALPQPGGRAGGLSGGGAEGYGLGGGRHHYGSAPPQIPLDPGAC